MKKKDIASSLVEEGLREAAEEFFGRRVRLEEEVEVLESLAVDLKKIERRVLHWRNLLYFLLLDGNLRVLQDFYSAISIDVHQEELTYEREDVFLNDILIPFSISKSKLYQKVFDDIYHQLASSINQYFNGSYTVDRAIPGKKVISIHYHQLKTLVDDLNERIKENNRYSKASEILQFTKKMDVDAQDKERITDSGLRYTLDEEMELKQIDFGELGLARFTPLPKGKDVDEKIRSFLSRLYRDNKQQVLELLSSIKDAERTRLSRERGPRRTGR
jgi:hypothetical protein